MDIKITAKNIKLTPAIKEYINTRVGKVENFFDNIVSAQVLISVEKKINQRAEIILHTGAKTTITASADVKFSVIKQVEVSPMNPEDAAYEMERLGYSFWMFLDEDSKQINLIFKRLDGTYGLIKPIKKK